MNDNDIYLLLIIYNFVKKRLVSLKLDENWKPGTPIPKIEDSKLTFKGYPVPLSLSFSIFIILLLSLSSFFIIIFVD